MSEQTGGEIPKGIDAARVTQWYAANVAGARPPLAFSIIASGHSNLTYRVTDAAGNRTVLRRPPLGAVLATAHDMGREHKILAALAQTDVPVAPVLGLCKDEAVNGAPFYVMRFVDGFVLDTADVVRQHVPERERMGLGWHVIEVLAKLHAVDIDAVGLGDLGKREQYLDRQIHRWRTQWEKSKTRELPAMEEVGDALEKAKPAQLRTGIVHGDYRIGNMLSKNGRIQAVLDWELCALGDPLADVGFLMNNWAEPGEEASPTARGAAQSPTVAGGFPTRAQLLARYEELTGASTANVDYFRAFQYWRLAAIVEGVMARYLKNVMGKQADVGAFKAQIDGLAASAQAAVRRLGA
jgi:aminoglycoside phosphotransferase (APT) family kinase protein